MLDIATDHSLKAPRYTSDQIYMYIHMEPIKRMHLVHIHALGTVNIAEAQVVFQGPSPANDKDVPRAGLEASGAGDAAAWHELCGLVRASGRHVARDDGLGGGVEEAHGVSNVEIAIGGTGELHLGGDRWAELAIMHNYIYRSQTSQTVDMVL